LSAACWGHYSSASFPPYGVLEVRALREGLGTPSTSLQNLYLYSWVLLIDAAFTACYKSGEPPECPTAGGISNRGVLKMKKGVSILLLLSVVMLLGIVMASPVRGQGTRPGPQEIQITAADEAAAADATVVFRHAFSAKNDAGDAFKHSQAASARQRAAAPSRRFPEGASFEGNDGLRFPGDVSDFFGGAVVPFAESHPIFLLPNNNAACTANACWGDPNTFLTDYADSGLAHVTDQYVGESVGDRYTLGNKFKLPYTPTPSTAPLTDADIRAIVHFAALSSGQTGYAHIFHVFLPPGQDECFTKAATTCYSPDVPASFAFCAYHSSVTFKDIGHVLYSVEPFQNVPGCQVRTGTPNGQLIDSTNSTLSHELTETITDPDGSGWFNLTDSGLSGEEIGDECDFFVLVQVAPGLLGAFGDPTPFTVGKHVFATQPEYSNADHACAMRP
jgi:hypothetical protein